MRTLAEKGRLAMVIDGVSYDLTDFASAAEEWIPPLNLVNPFEVDLLGAFMADPRNIVVLALILSIYVRVMLYLSILRALAQANNQQRTTNHRSPGSTSA